MQGTIFKMWCTCQKPTKIPNGIRVLVLPEFCFLALYLEFQGANASDFYMQVLFACTTCAGVHVCSCTVRVCVREGVHAFSCLFVFERGEPSQVTEVKPQLSDSPVNGGGLGSGLSGGGVKKDGESE